MASQLDRIENMLKAILQTTTSIQLDDTEKKGKELRDEIEKYKNKKEGA